MLSLSIYLSTIICNRLNCIPAILFTTPAYLLHVNFSPHSSYISLTCYSLMFSFQKMKKMRNTVLDTLISWWNRILYIFIFVVSLTLMNAMKVDVAGWSLHLHHVSCMYPRFHTGMAWTDGQMDWRIGKIYEYSYRSDRNEANLHCPHVCVSLYLTLAQNDHVN